MQQYNKNTIIKSGNFLIGSRNKTKLTVSFCAEVLITLKSGNVKN